LTYFTGLVEVLVGMIIPMFVWQSPKGRCYSNQLNLEDGRRHRQERPYSSLRRSTTDCTIVNLLSKVKWQYSGYIVSKFGELCPIIWEFTLLKRAIFAAIRPQFDDGLHSSRRRSKMDWKITILIAAEKSAVISVQLIKIS